MIAKTLTIATIAATVLCGCTPDDTKVTVNASALKAAVDGNVATAKVEMVLKTSIPIESGIPEKIRLAALPHLGENAEIKTKVIKSKTKPEKSTTNSKSGEPATADGKTETTFIATFNIPVGTAEAIRKNPYGILQLQYTPEDKTFRLVYGHGMSSLNSAMKRIDVNGSLEYTGGYISRFLFGHKETTINILNDDKITLGVAAVTVNERAIIAGSIDTQKGPLLIDYGNVIYSGKAPCFTYGGFQTMSSWSPARYASGN